MDQSVQEFDGTSGAWVNVASEVPAAVAEPEAPDAPEAAPGDEVAPEVKAKPRSDPKARVEAATAKEAAAKRERDEAKAETARLTAELAALKAPKTEPIRAAPVGADKEPTVDQFDTYEKYVKAQARWETREALREAESERQQHTVQQQREGAMREQATAFKTRYEAVLAADPDFESKVDQRLLHTPRLGILPDPSKGTFGNFLIEQVFQSEQPDVLLLHLSDPQVVQRLATLPPHQVIRELAKVELGAASPAAPAPNVQSISHARAPIRPVSSSPQQSSDEASDDDSDDEWLRKENAKQRRRGRG